MSVTLVLLIYYCKYQLSSTPLASSSVLLHNHKSFGSFVAHSAFDFSV